MQMQLENIRDQVEVERRKFISAQLDLAHAKRSRCRSVCIYICGTCCSGKRMATRHTAAAS